MIDAKVLASESNQNFIYKFFEKNNIGPERLILKGSLDRKIFLTNYQEIDIALDPFPYGGGTSTIEATLMGVPVISLLGNRWVSTMSAATLELSGHQELIAKNQAEYIEKASKLAADINRLDSYRKNLKADIQGSAMNIDKYVKNFEAALTNIWTEKFGL